MKERTAILANVKSMFRRLDVNSDGKLTPDELAKGLRELHIPLTHSQASSLVSQHAAVGKVNSNSHHDDDAHIDYEAFESMALKKMENLRAVYDVIDRNGDGRLSAKELRRGCDALGLKVSEDNLREWVAHLDVNKDGHVMFAEFCTFLCLLPEINASAVYEHFENDIYYEAAEGRQSKAVDLPSKPVVFAKDAKLARSYALTAALPQLVAGGVAGAVSRTATAPIDRLKMIVQASSGSEVSVWKTARDVYAEGGPRAFFRGNAANVMKVAPETAVKFLVFDSAKQAISRDSATPTVMERFVAGGIAGAVAQTCIYPLEIAKTRTSVSAPGVYRGTFDCLAKTVKAEGVGGLYRGLGASLAGIVPYAGIDLMVLSRLKDVVVSECEKRGTEPNVFMLLGCGMSSSTVAMAATYPLNLVRTRLQMGQSFGEIMSSVKGLGGMYRGVGVNAAKVLPSTAVSYAVYETLKEKISKQWTGDGK